MRYILLTTGEGIQVFADDIGAIHHFMSELDHKATAGLDRLLEYPTPIYYAAETSVDASFSDATVRHIADLNLGHFELEPIADRLHQAGVCAPTTGRWNSYSACYAEAPAEIEVIEIDKSLVLYRGEHDPQGIRLEKVATMPAGCYVVAWAGVDAECIATGYTLTWPSQDEIAARLSCRRATATCDACQSPWTGQDGNRHLTTGKAGDPVVDLDHPSLTDEDDAIRCPRTDCAGTMTIAFT